MTVFIHFKDNPVGLTALLVNLQPQLAPEDDIYIVDSSPDKSGLKIAEMYGSTRSYILIEVGDYSFEKASEFAYQSMRENKQDGILILSDRCVLPHTFIASLKRAAQKVDLLAPRISIYNKMNPNFKWFASSFELRDNAEVSQRYCLYIKNAPPRKKAIIESELVIVLPPYKPS